MSETAEHKFKRLPFHKRPFWARRILEVGGGHFPFKGVTHAVDKFPHDNTQRFHDFQFVKGVEFFEGDLENLPFDDAAEKFDFAYASHVLEHVDRPENAISELNRLTMAGYIETPSPLREQLTQTHPFDPDHFHRLFVWLEDGELHYIPRTAENHRSFPKDDPAAQVAKKLLEFQEQTHTAIEPLLPRGAKVIEFYYKAPIQIHRHESFAKAFQAGKNPYKASIDHMIKRVSGLGSAFSSRSRKLKQILAGIL